jgi:hypothetical protein
MPAASRASPPQRASRACPAPGPNRCCPSAPAIPHRSPLPSPLFPTSAADAGGGSRSRVGGRIGPARAQCQERPQCNPCVSAAVLPTRQVRSVYIDQAQPRSSTGSSGRSHGPRSRRPLRITAAIANDGHTVLVAEAATVSTWSRWRADRRSSRTGGINRRRPRCTRAAAVRAGAAGHAVWGGRAAESTDRRLFIHVDSVRIILTGITPCSPLLVGPGSTSSADRRHS